MAATRSEERLFNLVVALMATRHGLTKSEIFSSVRGFAEVYDPSDTIAIERLFERDKKFLRSFGIAIDVHDDPALSDNQSQRYRIAQEEYELPEGLEFTPDELRLIALATAVWQRGSLTAPAQFALTKLRGLGVDVSRSSGQTPIRFVVNEPNVEALAVAATEQKPVRFQYLASGYDNPIIREVLPIHVFLHHDRWHLYAWNLQSQVFRTYLVSRIIGSVVETNNRVHDVPEAASEAAVISDLDELFARNIAEIRVDPRSEAEIRLSRRSENPGESLLRIHYIDSALFADELCSYGPEVVVESPQSLRDLVIERLASMTAPAGGARA